MIWIAARTFTCGVLLNKEGIVTHTAPIVGYMKGWNTAEVFFYCEKRGWQARMQ